VQQGVYTPYLDELTNSDEGFDFNTGTMTRDPNKRDFIMYQYLSAKKMKGMACLHEELLTVPTEVPSSMVDTEAQLDLNATYIIRLQEGGYAKVIFINELAEGVEFEYVLRKADQTPVETTPGTAAPGTTGTDTTTPGSAAPGTTGTNAATPGTAGTGSGPVTIINNNTTNTINQNTNTTNNSADTNTNISGSTIANSNIASNNQTSQTTTNDNSIKVTQYVSVMVNGQPLQSDVKPFVNADGRTMLPVRAIAEALGATVQWDEATQTATLTLGEKTVKVTIGQNSLLVDGNPVSMDTAAAIKDGRTLLPVRAIGEALGAQVGWDEQTQTVKLDK
jgi:hypothetical protein